jgi:hypothetical protein
VRGGLRHPGQLFEERRVVGAGARQVTAIPPYVAGGDLYAGLSNVSQTAGMELDSQVRQ